MLAASAAGAAVVAWEVLPGPAVPDARAGTGDCDPSLSTLTTNHTSVPAGGNFAATVTATCLDSLGNPIPGRTIVLQASGGNSTITPPSAVTGANGVATFSVSDADVPPVGQGYSITYTALDQGAHTVFDQVVTIGFYNCACGGPPVPTAAIGGIGAATAAAVALIVWQLHRRRLLVRHRGGIEG